jgi:hypothetical protein
MRLKANTISHVGGNPPSAPKALRLRSYVSSQLGIFRRLEYGLQGFSSGHPPINGLTKLETWELPMDKFNGGVLRIRLDAISSARTAFLSVILVPSRNLRT